MHNCPIRNFVKYEQHYVSPPPPPNARVKTIFLLSSFLVQLKKTGSHEYFYLISLINISLFSNFAHFQNCSSFLSHPILGHFHRWVIPPKTPKTPKDTQRLYRRNRRPKSNQSTKRAANYWPFLHSN